MRCFNLFCVALMLVFSTSAVSSVSQLKQSVKQPNIILILADDLGFSDITPYGSEIDTPNLSSLAEQGLRFSNYHTAASCAPSRAMLMTGVDSHLAGVANIAEAVPPEHEGSPYYRGSLNQNVVTIASLLRDSGYHTYMAGKWHLGHAEPELRPINRGFEQTVMMPFSGADNWSNKSYLINYDKALWYQNGEEIELPEDFYSSKFIIDKAINQIERNRADGKPFFTYIGFQAVHIPVQAPKEVTQKYLDTYIDGWTALREKRHKSVKRAGLIPADAAIKTMPSTKDWAALSDGERRHYTKSMAVYAAMVDAMDHHIGRLIAHLKSIGEYDNSIFIFTSDNGPESSDSREAFSPLKYWLAYQGYNNDYETLGEANSYNYIGSSFASAAASPLGHYKFYSGEGGMRVPMIISGPGLAQQHRGEISNAMAYVKDLAPTILELGGVNHPGNQYKGRDVEPMSGRSLVPILSDQTSTVYSSEDVIAYEIGGNAALIKGDYKIIFNRGHMGDNEWHLYNIAKDPGETRRLESIEPLKYAELMSDYQRYAKENKVLPVPENYDQRDQVLWNGLRVRLINPVKNNIVLPLYALLSLVTLVLVVVHILRQGKAVSDEP